MLASTHKIIAKTSLELSAGFLHSVHGREERDHGEEWHRAPNEAGQGQVQVPHRPLIQLHGLYSELLVLLVLLDTFLPCYSVMRSRGSGGGIDPFCSVLLKLALTQSAHQISLNRYAHLSQTPRRATETTPLTTARTSQRRFSISMCSKLCDALFVHFDDLLSKLESMMQANNFLWAVIGQTC